MWKIAIIDDDRQVLKGMKQVIPWEDINAEWVGESLNGARGLELILEKTPDIVITDIYMPVMNGLTMIEKLQEENYRGKILIHSGYSEFEVARKAMRLNVEDYLSKPVSRNTLREVLLRSIAALESENLFKLEQDKLKDKLIVYERFVRKERLKSMVTGTVEGWNDDRSIVHGETGYQHLVLGIEILRMARICKARASDRLLFRFAVQNIIHEIVRGENIAFDYIELHGYHAALVFHFPNGAIYDHVIGTLRKIGNRIIECVQRYLQISVRIGIGGLKESVRELSDSMEESFQFLSQELPVVHSSGLFEYNDIESPSINPARSTGKPMKFYHHLVEDIKETQGKNAAKIIKSYIQTIKQHEAGNLQFRVLGAQFWAIISYALNDEEIHLEELLQANQIELELNKLHTLEHYEEWLNEMVRRICYNQEWHENFKHRLTIDFIKQYIHEHFDKDITIAELAEKVFISRNYLSQIFKNGTGETINNYIIQVKMEKAKVLLLERKLKIFEVAESVGYKNIPYFSTTFKKYFGVTPAEFIS